jgi:Mor family transcriptional regulator
VHSDEKLIEFLPGDLRRIAEVAGVEAALKIARAFRGTYLYVPGLDDLMKQIRDEQIRKEYDEGKPVKRLAIKYRLTERQIRRVLNSRAKAVHPLISRLIDEEETSK